MINQAYFPLRIGDQILWLQNLKTTAPQHASDLMLVPAGFTAFLLDVDTAIYAVGSYGPAVVSFHDATFRLIEDALDNTQLPGLIAWPSFTAPLPLPPSVAHGCLRRIFAYIGKEIKGSAGFTNAIGTNMRVVSPPPVALDLNAAKPTFTAEALVAGEVRLKWLKGAFDGVTIEGRAPGSATWTPLGVDHFSPFVDTRDNATPGQPEVREYRLRYLLKDEPVGEWSDTASVTTKP